MESEPMNLKQRLQSLGKTGITNLEAFADARWRRFADRMGFSQPKQIVAYRGYGNEQMVWIRGRVLANRALRGPADDDTWWDNLQATWERWETDEVAGAAVELAYGNTRRTVTTDEEGYYAAALPSDPAAPPQVKASLDTDDDRIHATHELTLPSQGAGFMLISDMDDTVIHTGITDLRLAAQLTFLGNARTRKPLPGVAALYRALVDRSPDLASNPVFYVSNSAWNLYDLLIDFMAMNDVPYGPLLLRDIGLNPANRDTRDHKAKTFHALMTRYAPLPAVLIGDSGQHDAALYADVARAFPGRVAGIYIRDVDPDHDSAYDAEVDRIIDDNSSSGVPMLRGRDSTAFAMHLQQLGLLSDKAVDEVRAAVMRDSALAAGR